MMPSNAPSMSVPSALINRSGPAAELRALKRVSMGSPFGSTTVCEIGVKPSNRNTRGRLAMLRDHPALVVPYRPAFAVKIGQRKSDSVHRSSRSRIELCKP